MAWCLLAVLSALALQLASPHARWFPAVRRARFARTGMRLIALAAGTGSIASGMNALGAWPGVFAALTAWMAALAALPALDALRPRMDPRDVG